MKDPISIKIVDGFVEGIDSVKRAQGLKHFFLGKGKLFPSSIQILHNINFSCKEGEKIAFIGGNGSGKSSLLKVIAGIYPLKSGSIQVCGSFAATIEMCAGFEPEMTGRQNIKILMLYNNMLSKYCKKIEDEVVEFSELGEKIDWPVKTYSSGMLSRLGFSVSIFQNPDILLLDEIFAAGDHSFVVKATELMKNKFKNVPISILVSHEEGVIRDNCNRCVLLKDGMIVADGDTDEILSLYNGGNY